MSWPWGRRAFGAGGGHGRAIIERKARLKFLFALAGALVMGFAPACSSRRVEKTPLTQRPTAVSSPSASPPALVEARLMFEVLRADTRRTTAQGTSFVAPKDWRIAIRGGATLLEPPEAG